MHHWRALLLLARLVWLVLTCVSLETGCKTTEPSEEGSNSEEANEASNNSGNNEESADEGGNEEGSDDEGSDDEGSDDEGNNEDGGNEGAQAAPEAQGNLFADDGSDEAFEQFLGEGNPGASNSPAAEASNPAPASNSIAPSSAAAPAAPLIASAGASTAEGTSSTFIASDFAGLPPLDGSRRTMAQGEAPEEYVVESGDTLIDICDQLLSEPGYWPKLWALNTYIKNPHFIWPGMRLRFYPGDDEAPPFLEVVTEEEFLPPGEGTTQLLKALVKESQLPSMESIHIASPPIIGPEEVGAFEAGIETKGDIYTGHNSTVTVPGFILKEPSQALCEVEAGTSGEYEVAESMAFVCNVPDEGGGVEVGQQYTALRYVGEVEGDDGEDIGHHYEFVAHVRVNTKISEGAQALGKVIKSRQGLRKDDLLVPYMPTSRVVNLRKDDGPFGQARARIVALEDPGQTVAAQGHMVFLNKGRNDGVQAGQLYEVQQNLQAEMLLHSYRDAPDHTAAIGIARIVDVTDVGAVAYIVYSASEIYQGDSVGKGS